MAEKKRKRIVKTDNFMDGLNMPFDEVMGFLSKATPLDIKEMTLAATLKIEKNHPNIFNIDNRLTNYIDFNFTDPVTILKKDNYLDLPTHVRHEIEQQFLLSE